MPIYKPSELRDFLSVLGTSPKKALSQNFLIDGNIIKKIVKTANVSSGDVVLEIGPGPGSLTEQLLQQGTTVVAVEKDFKLSEALKRLEGNLNVHCSDILEFPIEETLKIHLKKNQKAKVIANLPYHITTPILTHLIPMHHLFSSIIVMVQDEVAKRFTSSPRSKEYASITVFLNYFSNPNYAFKVSKRCFYPTPNVESAIVDFHLKTPPKILDERAFFKLVRSAFEQRRKMLRTSLKHLHSPESVMEALEKIGQNPQARPEELSLEKWLELFEELS